MRVSSRPGEETLEKVIGENSAAIPQTIFLLVRRYRDPFRFIFLSRGGGFTSLSQWRYGYLHGRRQTNPVLILARCLPIDAAEQDKLRAEEEANTHMSHLLVKPTGWASQPGKQLNQTPSTSRWNALYYVHDRFLHLACEAYD